MSRREKVIVSIMVATALLGGYWYYSPSAPNSHDRGERQSVEQIIRFAKAAIQKLRSDDSLSKDLFRMRTAERRWEKDPFIKSKAVLSDKQRVPAPQKKPVAEGTSMNLLYTGFIEVGAKRLAIINGIEYATGEVIDTQGHYIRRIQPHRVDIGKRDAPDMIILNYTESER